MILLTKNRKRAKGIRKTSAKPEQKNEDQNRSDRKPENAHDNFPSRCDANKNTRPEKRGDKDQPHKQEPI